MNVMGNKLAGNWLGGVVRDKIEDVQRSKDVISLFILIHGKRGSELISQVY